MKKNVKHHNLIPLTLHLMRLRDVSRTRRAGGVVSSSPPPSHLSKERAYGRERATASTARMHKRQIPALTRSQGHTILQDPGKPHGHCMTDRVRTVARDASATNIAVVSLDRRGLIVRSSYLAQ